MIFVLPVTSHPYPNTVRTDHILSIAGKRYGVGGVPRGAKARQIQDGPLVPGPWAYVGGAMCCD